MKKIILLVIVIFGITNLSIAQDTDEESPLSVSADVVSSFVWRGMVVAPTVNFQPMVDLSVNNFSFGFWGDGDISGIYKEIDIYATYSIAGFSTTVTDYFWSSGKKYFDFDNATTGHNIEIGLSYENEKFPLNIYVGSMIYGEDKKVFYDLSETDLGMNNHSTYLQLGYTFDIKQSSLNVFAGATPYTGMYGKDFAVVYVGFTASRDIKLTEKFSLPISVTFATNPQTQDYFTVLGISF